MRHHVSSTPLLENHSTEYNLTENHIQYNQYIVWTIILNLNNVIYVSQEVCTQLLPISYQFGHKREELISAESECFIPHNNPGLLIARIAIEWNYTRFKDGIFE